MKLLAPAGNLDSIKSAVYNGADEVYIGINQFNARNNIDGFSYDDLSYAVLFCHAYNVKILLAVNILFSDTEIQSALDLIVDAYNLGVDAFIVQDIGLISLLNEYYPLIPIHASTQMGIHNLEGVLEVEKLGVKRVVLARETPIDEIRRIKKNSNVEIEYFVHGALCVSFSGNCYLSSYLHDASGNRGRCKQLCRLPYTILRGDKPVKTGFLLSAKDICLIDSLKSLKDVGVDVLKIEGRARRSQYVGLVVSEYKKALLGNDYSKRNLELAFNRGFTPAYFNGNSNVISNLNNHVGVYVGEVLNVNNGKKFNEVKIRSNVNISLKSTLKLFYNGEEVNTISVYDIKKITNNTYVFTTTQNVIKGSTVNLILDNEIETNVSSLVRKNEINIELSLRANSPIFASTEFLGEKITLMGEMLEPAKSQPLSVEELESNFSKNEFFTPKITITCLEEVFMPKQKLNSFRREFYTLINNHISLKFKHDLDKIKLKTPSNNINFIDFEYTDKIKDNYKSLNVIFTPEEYNISDINNFILSCKKQGKTPYLDLPNFALENDIKHLRSIVNSTKISVIVNNLYALNFDSNKILGPGFNVYNSYYKKSFNYPVISAESDLFSRTTYPFMTLRHCPVKEHLGGDCNDCKYSDDIFYKTFDGKKFKLGRKKLSTCTFYLK